MLLPRYILVLLLSSLSVIALKPLTIFGLPRYSGAAQSSSTAVLRLNPTIFVRTKSVYFKPATLENELLKRPEVRARGMAITRDESNADYVVEIDRKLFTTKFVFSVLEVRSNIVVMSGKVSSLGGTVENKIADKFAERLESLRPLSSNVK